MPILKGAIPIFLPIEYPHKNRIDIPIPSETYFAVKGSFISRKGIVIGNVALNPIQKIIIPPLKSRHNLGTRSGGGGKDFSFS